MNEQRIQRLYTSKVIFDSFDACARQRCTSANPFHPFQRSSIRIHKSLVCCNAAMWLANVIPLCVQTALSLSLAIVMDLNGSPSYYSQFISMDAKMAFKYLHNFSSRLLYVHQKHFVSAYIDFEFQLVEWNWNAEEHKQINVENRLKWMHTNTTKNMAIQETRERTKIIDFFY